MEKILKNKKTFIVIGALVTLICILVAFSISGNIYGTWEVAERSINENLNDYPEDNFVIYENGEFTGDGLSGTYVKDKDTITFNFSIFGSYMYEYDIFGDTLMLRNIDDEDEPEIYYDRVS